MFIIIMYYCVVLIFRLSSKKIFIFKKLLFAYLLFNNNLGFPLLVFSSSLKDNPIKVQIRFLVNF